MKNDYVSSGRSVSDMKAHLVLTTKYRRKAFTGEMLKRLQEILFDLCQKWDCKLIEFNGEEDHIHLLFQYYPQMEIAKFVNNIKSVSSRLEEESSIFFIGNPLVRSKTPGGLPKSKIYLLARLSQVGDRTSSLSKESKRQVFSSFAKTEFERLLD